MIDLIIILAFLCLVYLTIRQATKLALGLIAGIVRLFRG